MKEANLRISWAQHLRADAFGLLLLTAFLFCVPVSGLVVVLGVPLDDWGVEEWKVLKLLGGLMTTGVALVFLAEWQLAWLVNRAIARRELVRTQVSEIKHDSLVTVIFPDAEPGRRTWPCMVVSTKHVRGLREGDPLTFPRIRRLSPIPFPIPSRIPLEAWFDPAEIAAALELD